MSLELYKPSEAGSQHHHYNTAVITKLLRNYRSHPAILKLPNDMFYDSELVPCANVVDREKLCKLVVIFRNVILESNILLAITCRCIFII